MITQTRTQKGRGTTSPSSDLSPLLVDLVRVLARQAAHEALAAERAADAACHRTGSPSGSR